jgi:zinc transport system ATP-binding protein
LSNNGFARAENALEIEHLSVAIDESPILADLSFDVPLGTTLAIIGPNGAGKSILLRALIGAVPSRGTLRWAPGTRLGYVPQKLDLERGLPLTGFDLLHAKAEICGSPRAEVDDVLKLVELRLVVAGQTIGTLSGGEFQRLLLAFALMGRPSALLVDEPTAGLDEPGVGAVYALLRRLQLERGLTVLLISHELSVVFEQADNVLCLAHGVRFFGKPIEVLTPEHLQQVYGGRVRFHRHGDATH